MTIRNESDSNLRVTWTCGNSYFVGHEGMDGVIALLEGNHGAAISVPIVGAQGNAYLLRRDKDEITLRGEGRTWTFSYEDLITAVDAVKGD